MRLVHVLKSAAAGLRHRAARHPAARPGRLVEVDDRAPAQEGHRGVLAHARGRALHLRLGAARRRSRTSPAGSDDASRARCTRSRCASSRPSGASKRAQRARARHDEQVQVHVDGDLDPACRLIFQRADGAVQGRLGEGDASTSACGASILSREGPRRHRHLPAEGREEPGLDRADRRHQLPQDRRVRLGLAIRARSTSTASSTSPTAASSSSSRC